jgi:F0F1-type ATP synthase membrane subunit b/b'
MVDPRLDDINNRAKAKLIELYSKYIEDTSDEFIQNAAVDIGNEFSNATDTLLNESISKAVNEVDSIAFGELSVEEAKEILKRLKELK